MCNETPFTMNRFPSPASLEPGTARPAGKHLTFRAAERNSRECSISDSGYTVSSRSHILVMVIVVVQDYHHHRNICFANMPMYIKD